MASNISRSMFPTSQSKVIMSVAVVAGVTLLVLGILAHQGILFPQIGHGGAWGLIASGVIIPTAALVFLDRNRLRKA